MSKRSSGRPKPSKPLVKGLIVQALLVMLLSFMISKLIEGTVLKDPELYHTLAEFSNVVIALTLFLNVWFTNDNNINFKRVLGFGFSIVAVFDLMHLYSFLGGMSFPLGSQELSTRYWVLGRLSEALILYLGVSPWFNPGLNKYLALLLTCGNAVAISYAVYSVPGLIPPLTNAAGGVSPFKIGVEYVVIFLFIISLYTLKKDLGRKDIVAYRYVFVALLIAIPTEVYFSMYDSGSKFSVFGHILKLAYYYYLLKGIYASALNYPYRYLQEILNDLPVGLLTYDQSLRATFANKQAAELLGYELSEIQGLYASDVAKLVYNNDATSSLAMTLLDSTSEVRNQVVNVKNCRVEHTLTMNAVRLENGGALLFFSDAKKEQEVENLQLQTKTILNAISAMVMLLDNSERILMCNQAFEQVTGLPAAEAIGLTLRWFKEMSHFQEEPFLFGGSGELEEGMPASMTNSKGEKKEVLFLTAPIHNLDGEIIGSVAIASDFTSLYRERQKLQQQEKLAVLGQMAAGIVHEIRNPLTTIKGFSQILEAKAKDEMFREYAGILVKTADEVNKVVTDFLAFAKPRPPLLQEVSIHELIESIKVMLDSQLFVKGVQFEIIPESEERTVLADEAQIKQVILNIVRNAIDAMSETEEPKLVIQTLYRQTQQQMVIQIRDNGKGMSREDIVKIGTPFYTTKDKGTGLGLSICFQIMKEHRGRIEIESELLKGSMFSLALPCHSQKPKDSKLPQPVN